MNFKEMIHKKGRYKNLENYRRIRLWMLDTPVCQCY